MRNRIPVTQVDNRDQGTTWLWINVDQYVEVDPSDLYKNMVENCFEGRKSQPDLETSDIQAMIDYLNEVLNGLS